MKFKDFLIESRNRDVDPRHTQAYQIAKQCAGFYSATYTPERWAESNRKCYELLKKNYPKLTDKQINTFMFSDRLKNSFDKADYLYKITIKD